MHKSTLLFSLFFFILPAAANADDRIASFETPTIQSDTPSRNTYRSYHLDLSEVVGRQNFVEINEALRRQIDTVESVGLDPGVLNFFHQIPIMVDASACIGAPAKKEEQEDKKPLIGAACYGSRAPKFWLDQPRNASTLDSDRWTNADPVALAEDINLGFVLVRPHVISPDRPTLLHEMLHAFHLKVMPDGEKNSAILYFYNAAKSGSIFPADAYVMTNEKEFFAVTASVFLSGKADDGATRLDIKQKQPEYYQYLVSLFGVDPELKGPSPLASAN